MPARQYWITLLVPEVGELKTRRHTGNIANDTERNDLEENAVQSPFLNDNGISDVMRQETETAMEDVQNIRISSHYFS